MTSKTDVVMTHTDVMKSKWWPDVMHESCFTSPHGRRQYLVPVRFMEISVGYARKKLSAKWGSELCSTTVIPVLSSKFAHHARQVSSSIRHWNSSIPALPTVHLSRDMTKPTKWVCAQRRLRSAWASGIRPGWSESSLVAHSDQPGHRPGWSVSSLGAHSLHWFCHVAAHLSDECSHS